MWQSSQEIIGNARDIVARVPLNVCNNGEFRGLCWLKECVRSGFGGIMVLMSGCCWLREKDIVCLEVICKAFRKGLLSPFLCGKNVYCIRAKGALFHRRKSNIALLS